MRTYRLAPRLLVLAVAVLAFPVTQPSPAKATPTPSPSSSAGVNDELQRDKLRAEIRQLHLNNARKGGELGWLLDYGPLLTVVIGAGTLLWTFYKQSRDLAQAQQASDRQAAQWREDFGAQQKANLERNEQWRQDYLRLQQDSQAERKEERMRRFDQNLTGVITNIGSSSQAARLNAAAALGIFVKPEYPDLHCDLLNVIVANLKAKPDRDVADLLRVHLAEVLRLLFVPGRELDPHVGDRVDLSRTDLYRLDAHGLDLRGTVVLDVAFAQLRHANFREANLFRARGLEATLDGAHFSRANMEEARFNKAKANEQPVDFHDTRLISATFEGALLPDAEFQQAKLQGAHLRRATLTGAKFEEANLADARFNDAVLDEVALRSVALGARNWRQAFFDPPVRDRLEAISAAT